MAPHPVTSMDTDQVVAVTNQGRMLVIPAGELPTLAKGKGIKIIGIPSAKVSSREEYMVGIASVPEGHSLTVYAGKRHLSLKPDDLAHYAGERGRRGLKLPRGLQRVDAIQVTEE
jgi:topoisomerase-4 subunit A